MSESPSSVVAHVCRWVKNTPPIDINPTEFIVRNGAARYQTEEADGWLVLTNERLWFREYRRPLIVWKPLFRKHVAFSWPLRDVVRADRVRWMRPWFGWTMGGIDVRTRDGKRHRFHVYAADRWLRDVNGNREMDEAEVGRQKQ